MFSFVYAQIFFSKGLGFFFKKVVQRIFIQSYDQLMKFVQINLHKSFAAAATLVNRFEKEEFDIALIQEPYQNKNKVCCLNTAGGVVISECGGNRPRSCILLNKNIKFLTLTEYCNEDITTIELNVKENDSSELKIVLSSVYMPFDSLSPPPHELIRDLVKYCNENKRQLILGCDANAHHINWGSSDINLRGTHLMEFISENNLEIANKGNEPTFITSNRKEVIDITLVSLQLVNRISNWRVSDKMSLSDHQYLEFNLSSLKIEETEFRNPKKTDWVKFRLNLLHNLQPLCEINSCLQLETKADELQNAITKAYEESCMLKKRKTNRKCTWFTPYLHDLRQKTRKLWNKAKKKIKSGSFNDEAIRLYRESLTLYMKEIRKAKELSWKIKCEEINCTNECARINKLLSKHASKTISSLKKSDGTFTRDINDTLETLLHAHFPNSTPIDVNEQVVEAVGEIDVDIDDLINEDRLRWVINSFKSFKSPGLDGIYPAFLKEGYEIIKRHLLVLFKESIRLSYIPKAWRGVNISFIPKPAKESYANPKAYRPISLMSFILKTLEKMVDMYIREKHISSKPLHKLQFAYQAGKSTDAALQCLNAKISKTLMHKEFGLGAFIDIEGAFNNISYNAIVNSAKSFNISSTLIQWILKMLKSRIVTASLHDVTVRVNATRGCPQGGCISCLLWLMVVDSLLCRLNAAGGVWAQGFADDVVIFCSGKFANTVQSNMQRALHLAESWCLENELSINPTKTAMIPFTNRRNLNLKLCRLFNTDIQFASETKYLGIYFDSKLKFSKHLDYVISKAIRAFWACKRMVGTNWGLKPKIIHWLYSQIVLPMLTHGSVIWWEKSQQVTSIKKLSSLQRIASLVITGSFRSTPSASLEMLLGLTPLHIHIKSVARKVAIRLASTGHWTFNTKADAILYDGSIDRQAWTNSDKITPRMFFNRNFEILIHDRDSTGNFVSSLSVEDLQLYSDGAKTSNGTGIGVYSEQLNINLSLNVGNNTTVFQSEVKAIQVAACECNKRNLSRRQINIFTDSKAALNSLSSFRVISKTIQECLKELLELGRKNVLRLVWVPGHSGFLGNEIADELAKHAICQPLVDIVLPIMPSVINTETSKFIENEHNRYWNSVPGQKTCKLFVKKLDSRRHKSLLSMQRKDLSYITRFITGHSNLNQHLNRIGLINSSVCRFCEEEDETSEHLLCNCLGLTQQRNAILKKDFINIQDLEINVNVNVNEVLKFIKLIDCQL
jgi:ribonuclease HI